MAILELKKYKDKHEINLYYSKSSGSHYRNIVDKDPNKLAQIFIDLMFEGYPIKEAIKIFNTRFRNRDWLGL